MKVFSFYENGSGAPHLGVQARPGARPETGNALLDVTEAARAAGADEGVPASLDALLSEGFPAAGRLQAFVEALPAGERKAHRVDADGVRYAPCVAAPEKIICIGLNYRRHAEESGAAIPEVPVVFSKFGNTLAGAGEPVPLLGNATEFDYEVELGAVIGRPLRRASEGEAAAAVLGYCPVNDLSVRDLQRRTSQWLLGKTPDKFMPVGPALTLASEAGDPRDLRLRCWVNGELRQDSTTADMIFPVAECVSYLSQYMTLRPGDLISTGTPEGVVLGREERDWLTPGDEVTVEIETLGRLTNPLVAE